MSNENEIRRLQGQVQNLESRVVNLCSRIEDLKAEDRRRALVEAQQKAARREVLRLTRKHGIPLDNELREYDRIAVWAPASLDSDDKDPFNGDHYVYSWAEALKRVEKYVEILNYAKVSGR